MWLIRFFRTSPPASRHSARTSWEHGEEKRRFRGVGATHVRAADPASQPKPRALATFSGLRRAQSSRGGSWAEIPPNGPSADSCGRAFGKQSFEPVFLRGCPGLPLSGHEPLLPDPWNRRFLLRLRNPEWARPAISPPEPPLLFLVGAYALISGRPGRPGAMSTPRRHVRLQQQDMPTQSRRHGTQPLPNLSIKTHQTAFPERSRRGGGSGGVKGGAGFGEAGQTQSPKCGCIEGANRVAASRPKALAMVVRTGNSPSPSGEDAA